MGIQAREIIRFAKRNGMTLRRKGVATLANGHPLSGGSCALSVLASMHGVRDFFNYPTIRSHFPGITATDLVALEYGFEGLNWGSDNRYYKVGRNVAKLAGLIS